MVAHQGSQTRGVGCGGALAVTDVGMACVQRPSGPRQSQSLSVHSSVLSGVVCLMCGGHTVLQIEMSVQTSLVVPWKCIYKY